MNKGNFGHFSFISRFAVPAMLLSAHLAACGTRSECDDVAKDGEAVSYSVDRNAARARLATVIAQQGRLYSTACQVHKVVLFTDEAQFKAPLFEVDIPGDRKIAVPIDVTLKGYVDFSAFSADNVEIRDSLCLITLPDPAIEITASKIDHTAVRQYVSMTRRNFSDADINRLAAQGKDTIAHHLNTYGIVERSRESCARNLIPILKRMGYNEQNVVIRFGKDYSDHDLRNLTLQQ